MDWQKLENQTVELVAQDYLSFPRVQRDLGQLQQAAEQARARTSKILSVPNAIAAARLLAQQGVDTSRLTQDVTSLELQPTLGELYAGEPASVDAYLRQLEEASVLAALSESQADTVASFDRFMDECMARDWQSDKARLFAVVAPHAGVAPAAAAGFAAAAAGGLPDASTSGAAGALVRLACQAAQTHRSVLNPALSWERRCFTALLYPLRSKHSSLLRVDQWRISHSMLEVVAYLARPQAQREGGGLRGDC